MFVSAIAMSDECLSCVCFYCTYCFSYSLMCVCLAPQQFSVNNNNVDTPSIKSMVIVTCVTSLKDPEEPTMMTTFE